MDAWIAFGKGPLFRFSFVLLLLMWARFLVLSFADGIRERRVAARKLDFGTGLIEWMFRIGRLWRRRPLHSLVSTLFHYGLLAVPLFLAAHVNEWRDGVGFAWWSLNQPAADKLTILVMITAPLLIILHLAGSKVDRGSTLTTIFWLGLLTLPFITGYYCANIAGSAPAWQKSMLIHVYSGNLLLLAASITGVARCIIEPVTNMTWKLGYSVAGARWLKTAAAPVEEQSE